MTELSLFLIISYICLWVLAFLLIAVVFYLARQVGLLQLRVGSHGALVTDSGPRIGQTAPEYKLTGVDGSAIKIGGKQQTAQMIVFLSSGCSACRDLAPELRTFAAREKREFQTLVIVRSGDALTHEFIEVNRLREIASIDDGYAVLCGIFTMPYSLLISMDGTVLSKGLVNNLAHLESLLEVMDLDSAELGPGFPRESGTAAHARSIS